MFKLIRNEYSKLFTRRTTQILLVLLLLAAIGLAFFFHLPLFNDKLYETVDISAESAVEEAGEIQSPEDMRHQNTENARLAYLTCRHSRIRNAVDPSQLETARNDFLIAQ